MFYTTSYKKGNRSVLHFIYQIKEVAERVITSIERLRKRYNPKQISAIFDREICRI
jgi:hypothetical protein